MNSSQIPAFDVYRSVTPMPRPGGSPLDFDKILVNQALAAPEIDVEEERLQKLFEPARNIRAILLGSQEVIDFHEDIGVTPTDSQRNDLQHFVLGSLAKTADSHPNRLRMELQYQRVRRRLSSDRLDVVLRGDLVPERRKAIAALGEFYGIDMAQTSLGGLQDEVRGRVSRGKSVWQSNAMKRTAYRATAGLFNVPKGVAGVIDSTKYDKSTPVN